MNWWLSVSVLMAPPSSGLGLNGKGIKGIFIVCRYIIQKLKDPGRAHQVKMDSVLKALRWLNIDMDIDEVSTPNPLVVVIMGLVKSWFP